MYHSPLSFLQHIMDEIEYLIRTAKTTNREEFTRNETLRRAFVRSLEIIGEAAKHIPEDFRAHHSDIDWRAMTGMRDKLIHGYFTIDYDIVWHVVTRNLPKLRVQIRDIVDDARSP